MSLSLIITTYNKPDALFLVMQSISCQSILPSEVIIADDGSDKKTQKLINTYDNRRYILGCNFIYYFFGLNYIL